MPTLTNDQVTALAPDAASLKASRPYATHRRWQGLGHTDDTQVIWGLAQGSGKTPYKAQIDLSGPAYACTCPSRKFPCKHTLGLLFVYAADAHRFNDRTPPDWVEKWLTERQKRAEQRQRKLDRAGEVVDPAAQAERANKRLDTMAAGLDELETWLSDMLYEGLAAAPTKKRDYWDTMARRMVDAQLPALLPEINALYSTLHSGSGWPDRFLVRLGRLNLAIQAFRQFDSLPPTTQSDLRAFLGWNLREEDLLPLPPSHDHWLILGRRVFEEDNLRGQRVWLWGEATSQPALLLDFAFVGPGGNSQQALDTTLTPGHSFQADLVFYPGAAPLRAAIRQRQPLSAAPFTTLSAALPLPQALAEHNRRVARNPWLLTDLLVLRDVQPVQTGGRWLVTDGDHALPVVRGTPSGWPLLALSAGQPITIIGEWRDHTLHPLSAVVDSRLVPL